MMKIDVYEGFNKRYRGYIIYFFRESILGVFVMDFGGCLFLFGVFFLYFVFILVMV